MSGKGGHTHSVDYLIDREMSVGCSISDSGAVSETFKSAYIYQLKNHL